MYHKNLYKGEIKRCDNTNKRDDLKNTTQKSITEEELKGSKNEDTTKEGDAKLSKRNAENARILTRGDNITVRKIGYGTNQWRITYFILSEVYRVSKPEESEYYDTHDTSALHIV